MNTMTITSAQYAKNPMTGQNVSVKAVVDGEEILVPLTPGNRHYDAIMAQVDAGDLVIQEADA